MLTGGATAKIVSTNYNGVFGFGFARVNEAGFIRRWKTNEGVRTKLLILIGIGRDEGEVLSGDDLVSVDVVAHDVTEAVECSDGGNVSRGGCSGTERGGDAVMGLRSELRFQGFEVVVLRISSAREFEGGEGGER